MCVDISTPALLSKLVAQYLLTLPPATVSRVDPAREFSATLRSTIGRSLPAAPSPQRQAVLPELALTYRLRCAPHHFGAQCSVNCVPSDDDVSGHYTCEQSSGERVCLAGWRNGNSTHQTRCREPVCQHSCRGPRDTTVERGRCSRPGKCECVSCSVSLLAHSFHPCLYFLVVYATCTCTCTVRLLYT